jgi:hypothetical protein
MIYPYIRAWGRMMGSSPVYVERQVERARRDRAPADAIFYGRDRRWHQFRHVNSGYTRFVIEEIVGKFK